MAFIFSRRKYSLLRLLGPLTDGVVELLVDVGDFLLLGDRAQNLGEAGVDLRLGEEFLLLFERQGEISRQGIAQIQGGDAFAERVDGAFGDVAPDRGGFLEALHHFADEGDLFGPVAENVLDDGPIGQERAAFHADAVQANALRADDADAIELILSHVVDDAAKGAEKADVLLADVIDPRLELRAHEQKGVRDFAGLIDRGEAIGPPAFDRLRHIRENYEPARDEQGQAQRIFFFGDFFHCFFLLTSEKAIAFIIEDPLALSSNEC
jgi:hypothetical protein